MSLKSIECEGVGEFKAVQELPMQAKALKTLKHSNQKLSKMNKNFASSNSMVSILNRRNNALS